MPDPDPAPPAVSYDGATFSVRGERVFLLIGSVHYPRVPSSRWAHVFQMMKRAGLNTVETYVFWGEHEPSDRPRSHDGAYDFSGRRDLFGFLAAAHAAGLYAVLRIGPYVCAEVSYGGFPFALRGVPGVRFRTLNKPFQDAVERWVGFVAAELHRRGLLARDGGPVLLVQLENEYQMVAGAYGGDGEKYLQWCADLQHKLDFGVPTIMCFGSADGAVETINAFYAHKEVGELRDRHPDQPALWTECWSGWYDVWGAPHHRRPTEDLAYAVARWFAAGGGGVCYYLWMGGTNFGRTPMYLQATSYDYDAPIDEFGMETTKSRHLTRLHDILRDRYAPALFSRGDDAVKDGRKFEAPEPVWLSEFVALFEWSPSLAFVCNDSEYPSPLVHIPDCDVQDMTLPARSVRVVDLEKGVVLYESDAVAPESIVAKVLRDAPVVAKESEWIARVENVTSRARMVAEKDISCPPPDQLTLTEDKTDYCFYTAGFKPPHKRCDGVSRVEVTCEAADFLYVFLDGEPLGHSSEPLWEDRKNNTWNKTASPPECRHVISGSVRLEDNGEEHVWITFMTCSLGLAKGDWQLGDSSMKNMQQEKKGLFREVRAVCFEDSDGEEIVMERTSPWQAAPGLSGESSQVACTGLSVEGSPAIPVLSPREACRPGAPVWLEKTFTLAETSDSLVVDLGSMGKGLLWVNGELLGRYWSIAGTRPRNGFLDGSPIIQDRRATQTQRYYHIPRCMLLEQDGGFVARVTLFEERGNEPAIGDVRLHVWAEES